MNICLYHNLILFSENNYKKQAQMFYQNHSLAQTNFYDMLDLDSKNT